MRKSNYEKTDIIVVAVAVAVTLALMICGLATGLACAVQKRRAPDNSREMAKFLLEESAESLNGSLSALRLCVDPEPVEALGRTALVYTVRAETALECHYDDWADSRSKEAFLNDVATVLHSYTPEETIELADTLYEFSSNFLSSIRTGETFRYDGELVGGKGDGDTDDKEETEITDEDIAAGAELVENALDTDETVHVGSWNGHIEYAVLRGGNSGYAIVCGDKIIEYSFIRGEGDGDTDTEKAATAALESAERCGYKDLKVRWSEVTGRSVTVVMCKNYDGAYACDDCATAVVFGGEVVAFTAGGCDCEHSGIPTPVKTELDAHKKINVETGEGMLVVRRIDGKERICYEYRITLDDGVHYVYVCAESGKQIEVK